ncbi:MAG: lipoyl synthase [Candidatus Helarchaeota archaeon]
MQLKKPAWISTTVDLASFQQLITKIRNQGLYVVCFEASCPNIGTCFHRRTATFLILGRICTRSCRFCGIEHGIPINPDPNEPRHVARLVQELGLKHVVITSVSRDDLPDYGVTQFIDTIREIRNRQSEIIIEVLIPDFQGQTESLNQLIHEKPDIINHNIETIPRLYATVRPQANYTRSLHVLNYIKQQDPSIYTKSGFMVGLGETFSEIFQVIRDLKEVQCDILTIGQYLRPSENHLPVQKYYTSDDFQKMKNYSETIGFTYVSAAPLVRSSFMADNFSKGFMR